MLLSSSHSYHKLFVFVLPIAEQVSFSAVRQEKPTDKFERIKVTAYTHIKVFDRSFNYIHVIL